MTSAIGGAGLGFASRERRSGAAGDGVGGDSRFDRPRRTREDNGSGR
jgi:hypothetical protein